MRRTVRGRPVRTQSVWGGGGERSADDLLDVARVQVYAGAETGHCASSRCASWFSAKDLDVDLGMWGRGRAEVRFGGVSSGNVPTLETFFERLLSCLNPDDDEQWPL